MEALEAMVLDRPGEITRAALRSGTVVIVAIRLGAVRWKPLYAVSGPRQLELPKGFRLSLKAIAALETAVVTH